MDRSITTAAFATGLLLVASPLVAQANPFKLPKNKVSAIQVDYTYAGDLTGTGQRSIAGDRVASHETTTGKFFGKTSTHDTWTLMTPDSMYTADLTKKTGTRMPNMLPAMAKAYDGLDGAGKQRLHQNMQEMSQMISRAFGTGTLMAGQKGETRTYAGEKCDERTFGTFTICSMQGTPGVPLHVSGSLLCVNYEQTATAVRKGEPPASAFSPPAGVTFQNTMVADVDSVAHGYVTYLASQELADSLAAAKAKMASAQPEGTAASPASTRQLTPEEKAQAKQACEALKNFDLGKEMKAATNRVVADAVKEALKEKQNEAEQGAKNKIKGLIKRPHF